MATTIWAKSERTVQEINFMSYLQKDFYNFLISTVELPIAIITARIYYVLFEGDYFKNHISEMPAIWQGGIAIHGGLIGAILTAIIFTQKRKISFWKLADITAPSILLGQAIGRWGNFMNQEGHGGPVSKPFLKQLHLPDFIINQMNIDGVYYHPP